MSEINTLEPRAVDPQRYDNNQMGFTARFIDEWGHGTRWSEEKKRWLVWGARVGVWTVDLTHTTEDRMQHSVINQLAATGGDLDRATQRLFSDCLKNAKAKRSAKLSDFDVDPWILNTPAGSVDLRTGVLRDHQAGDMFLKITAGSPDFELNEQDEKIVVWDPEKYPGFVGHLQFMCQWKSEDESADVERVLRRFCGMAGVGSQNEKPHLVLNLSGKGRNGKGHFVELIAYTYGDYAKAAPKSLLTRRSDAHSTEDAGMQGIRFSFLEELKLIQAQVFKDLTGGGTMSARKMRSDDVTFRKMTTYILNGNDPINVQGDGSDGMKDRLLKIQLGKASDKNLRRDGVIPDLEQEADGILSWMIVGCREWVEGGRTVVGLGIAEWMNEETIQERDDDDVLLNFIRDCYKEQDERLTLTGNVVPALIIGSVFVAAYNEYRKAIGYPLVQPPEVYQNLRGLGYEVKKGTKNKTCVYGFITTLTDDFGTTIDKIGPMNRN